MASWEIHSKWKFLAGNIPIHRWGIFLQTMFDYGKYILCLRISYIQKTNIYIFTFIFLRRYTQRLHAIPLVGGKCIPAYIYTHTYKMHIYIYNMHIIMFIHVICIYNIYIYIIIHIVYIYIFTCISTVCGNISMK